MVTRSICERIVCSAFHHCTPIDTFYVKSRDLEKQSVVRALNDTDPKIVMPLRLSKTIVFIYFIVCIVSISITFLLHIPISCFCSHQVQPKLLSPIPAVLVRSVLISHLSVSVNPPWRPTTTVPLQGKCDVLSIMQLSG